MRFQALKDTQSAFSNVLGYRLYRDLKRGWRITLPIWSSADSLKSTINLWMSCGRCRPTGGLPRRTESPAGDKSEVAKVLLDHMRRELAIQVDYLDSGLSGAHSATKQPAPPGALGDRRERRQGTRLGAFSPQSGEQDAMAGIFIFRPGADSASSFVAARRFETFVRLLAWMIRKRLSANTRAAACRDRKTGR